MLDNEQILKLQDEVAVLQFQNEFLIGELRNCKKIFEHEGKAGYSLYVSKALEMVNADE